MTDSKDRSRRTLEGSAPIEVLVGLWGSKFIIAAVIIICTSVAGLYAVFASPVYESSVLVGPPSLLKISDFNIARGNAGQPPAYSQKEIYNFFLASIPSETIRQNLYNEVYLKWGRNNNTEIPSESYSEFTRRLTSAPVIVNGIERILIRFQDSNHDRAKNILEKYVETLDENARSQVAVLVSGDAGARANVLERQIVNMRAEGKAIREDRIIQLKEALVVASSIGLVQPMNISKADARLSDGVKSLQDYMRGTKALEAEILNLKQRVSDDPFIDKLRLLQVEYNFLKNVDVDLEKVETIDSDRMVVSSEAPIRPHRKLIILTGIVAGVVLGVFSGLILFVRKRRYSTVIANQHSGI